MMTQSNKTRSRATWAGIFGGAFLILAFLVKTNAPVISAFDKRIQALLYPITNPQMTSFVDKLTFLGGPEMSFIYCLILVVILALKHSYFNAWWTLATVVICNLLNWIIKYIVARPRPADRLVHITGYSFPSGHTFGTALFVFLVLYLLWPHFKTNITKYLMLFIGGIWIITIALTRIYLHVHYPSDTLASVLLVATLFNCSLIIRTHFKNKN